MQSRVSISALILLAALARGGQARAQAGVSDWPREFTTPRGHTIVLYQPQAETFRGDRLTGRAAVSFTKKGAAAPKFGVVFFGARVSVDRDARQVSVLDMKVSRVRFPGITPENERKFTESLESEVPKWDLVFSYDRLLESVKVAEREKRSAEGLKHDPPQILFAQEPSVLLLFDGEPGFREVEGAPVRVAVNASFFLVNDTRSGRYYLSGGKNWWYEAANPLGPWRTIGGPPADIAQFAARAQAEQKKEDTDAAGDDGTEASAPPKIVVATEPTELVVTEGKPSLKPVAGTDGSLLAVENTEGDVLLDVARQDFYVLLAGRWFRGKSLASGAGWAYVAPDALPESFAKIPPDSDSGDVRAAVAGTDEAEEAVLDAQIPQTTAVRRADATLDVKWDGAPKFIPVDGSATAYAVNASTSVLQIRNRYYACENAVWFVGDAPDGPWAVADDVPSDDIDAIPPSAPVYNVKYVRIYDATPEFVTVGYTPGYTGVYPWRGTVVWGTGWTYRPWVGPVYWWPRPYTWGLSAHYNPWMGWGFGYSWSYPFFSVSFGWGEWFRPAGWWRPAYGGWHRGGFGPGGYRPPTVIVNSYWGGRGGGAWSRPLPSPRPGAMRV
ncbi:MAG: carbohydrate-binding family V/XII, partial [Thermoanaerobaculia bacterium]